MQETMFDETSNMSGDIPEGEVMAVLEQPV